MNKVIQIIKWGEPKPNHEFQYYLAWKHRHMAGRLLLRANYFLLFLWNPKRYARIMKLWSWAVERTKLHGQDSLVG